MINGRDLVEFVGKSVIEEICSTTQSEILMKEESCQQGCKKIIDLDLKDRDHLIDLDLLGDLDHYW